MEQVARLISKACVVLVLMLVSVVIEEYINFGRNFKKLFKSLSAEEGNKQQIKGEITYNVLTQVVQGLLFSIFMYMDTNTAEVGMPGIIYDARTVILNLSMVYGPIAFTVTAVFAAIIRIISDVGNAAIPVVGIMAAYIFEISVLYYLKSKGKTLNIKIFSFITFATGIGSGISLFTMAGDGLKTQLLPAFVMIVIFPVFTISAYRLTEVVKNSNRLIVELYRSDEKFNKMNDELQERLEELRENEAHFRTMFYYSGEAIFLIKDHKIVDINKAGMELLGYRREEEIIGTSFASFVMELKPDEVKRDIDVDKLFEKVKKGETLKTELQIMTRNLSNVHIEVFMTELKTPANKYIYISARDVSARKIQEKEILYKSRYDEITNVANRKYFNEVMEKALLNPNNYPICYLMADINGLKLTNDVFGHAKGDELIVKISSALNSCCRSNDIVARIGGDEFAIFFTNTDEKTARSLVDRINRKLDNEAYDTVKPSVSMGYAVKKGIGDKDEFSEIVKKADAMMYANKSATRERNRKVFLANMLDKLYEINPEEREQKEELDLLLKKFTNIFPLEPAIEKGVEKLITYVNIGKLVTSRIDWDMKGDNLHSLRFSRKLLENTDVILDIINKSEDNIISTEELYSLNENWDGSGEKYSSSGEEIPLISRIFKLLYDVYYLKTQKGIVGALTDDEIIALIRSECGKRYDPRLCDCRLEEIL